MTTITSGSGEFMKNIDKTVIKETKYIAVCVLVISIIMQSVFLIIRKWDYTVLLGNAFIGFFSVLNFFLMGLSVSKAVVKEEKEAKSIMKLSQTYRMLLMAVVLIIGLTIPVFNKLAVIITVFFPRIAVMLRGFLIKN